MAEVERTTLVRAGKWRTLESGWNVSFACRFVDPAGAKVKARYGDGWPFGRNGQEQTLDGVTRKTVSIGKGSLVYARVQMRVQQDAQVTYSYIIFGP
jgi:hypothetical protein